MDVADLLLAGCMFLAAVLYTSVGHAGASAYLALMALFGTAPAVMRPTALALNILVGSFTAYRYVSAGYFRWRTVWPFLLGAVPFAFLGGTLALPAHFYRPVVGVILLLAAARFLFERQLPDPKTVRDPGVAAGMAAGAGIGLLSGLTGTGGGIFLSPLLLVANWSETRTASGVVIVFILGNSVAGLLGNYASVGALPANLPLFGGAVLLGAVLGTTLGISRLAPIAIRKALGLVLVIAGIKLIGL